MTTSDAVLILWCLVAGLVVLCLHLAARLAHYHDAERRQAAGWDGIERRRRPRDVPAVTGATLVRQTCEDCGVRLTLADHHYHCNDCATVRMARDCT